MKLGKEAGEAFEKAASIQRQQLNEPDDEANTLTEAFSIALQSDTFVQSLTNDDQRPTERMILRLQHAVWIRPSLTTAAKAISAVLLRTSKILPNFLRLNWAIMREQRQHTRKLLDGSKA